MPTKRYAKDRATCQVTFALPKEVAATTAALCGDFNDWDPTRHPLKRAKDGSFKAAVELAAGRSYRYRYLLDGDRWENDGSADAYAPNAFGSEDCVVHV
jgi:1,4-alpha-glucan branching enzyme